MQHTWWMASAQEYCDERVSIKNIVINQTQRPVIILIDFDIYQDNGIFIEHQLIEVLIGLQTIR